jgi:hypothetical protein
MKLQIKNLTTKNSDLDQENEQKKNLEYSKSIKNMKINITSNLY